MVRSGWELSMATASAASEASPAVTGQVVTGSNPATQYSDGGPLQVIVFNDHPVFRSALSWKMGKELGVQVVADAASLHETLALAKSRDHEGGTGDRIDAVIADLRIGDGNSEGVESVKVLSARLDNLPVIVSSDMCSRSYTVRMAEAGAAAVLPKSASMKSLAEAVRSEVAQRTLSPEPTTDSNVNAA